MRALGYEREQLSLVVAELESVATDCGILLARALFLQQKLQTAAKAEFGKDAVVPLDLPALLLEEIKSVQKNPPQPKHSFAAAMQLDNVPRHGLVSKVTDALSAIDRFTPLAPAINHCDLRPPAQVLCKPVATGGSSSVDEDFELPFNDDGNEALLEYIPMP